MCNLLRLAAAATVLAACTGLASPRGEGASSVQLHNDGTVVLHDVRVTTGEDVPPVTDAVLLPGEITPAVAVRVVHGAPMVRAVVDGRELVLHPIEGFMPGFNPPLEPGRYVIRIRVGAEGQLDLRIERP